MIQETNMKNFTTKDSGEREQFESGMQRDTATNKPRTDLIDESFLRHVVFLYNPERLKCYDAFMEWFHTDNGDAFNTALIEFLKVEQMTIWEFIEQVGLLMKRGAEKYDEHNWKKASGEKEMNRFKQSAHRHFTQWALGETDEAHGIAALGFNVPGYLYVERKLK